MEQLAKMNKQELEEKLAKGRRPPFCLVIYYFL